jgi:hypothetical protein
LLPTRAPPCSVDCPSKKVIAMAKRSHEMARFLAFWRTRVTTSRETARCLGPDRRPQQNSLDDRRSGTACNRILQPPTARSLARVSPHNLPRLSDPASHVSCCHWQEYLPQPEAGLEIRVGPASTAPCAEPDYWVETNHTAIGFLDTTWWLLPPGTCALSCLCCPRVNDVTPLWPRVLVIGQEPRLQIRAMLGASLSG